MTTSNETNSEPDRFDLLELDGPPSKKPTERQAIPTIKDESAVAASAVCTCPIGTRTAAPRNASCPDCKKPRTAPKGAKPARVASEETAAIPTDLAETAARVATETAPRSADLANDPTYQRNLAANREATAERNRVLNRETMVLGVETAASGEMFSWDGLGSIKRSQLFALREQMGIPADWMPDPKSAKLQASRALRELTGYVVFTEKRTEATEKKAYDTRWTVGRVDHRGGVGDKLGGIDLVATLVDKEKGTLNIDGDADLARQVRARFDEYLGEEVYQGGDVTNWLQNLLVDRLLAVRYGHNYYVPRQSVATARKIANALHGIRWGEGWVGIDARKCPMASIDGIRDGLALGLTEEVERVVSDFEEYRSNAKSEAARKGKDVAGADAGPRAAKSYVDRLRGVGERIVAYGALLGNDKVAALRERVRVAMQVAEEILAEQDDGLLQRFDNIWEEIERDRARNGGAL